MNAVQKSALKLFHNYILGMYLTDDAVYHLFYRVFNPYLSSFTYEIGDGDR